MSPRARFEPHALGLEPVGRGGTFRVLEDNLPALRLRVERLGRRAERLGTAPLVLRDTGRRDGQHAFAVLEGEPPRWPAGHWPRSWTTARARRRFVSCARQRRGWI